MNWIQLKNQTNSKRMLEYEYRLNTGLQLKTLYAGILICIVACGGPACEKLTAGDQRISDRFEVPIKKLATPHIRQSRHASQQSNSTRRRNLDPNYFSDRNVRPAAFYSEKEPTSEREYGLPPLQDEDQTPSILHSEKSRSAAPVPNRLYQVPSRIEHGDPGRLSNEAVNRQSISNQTQNRDPQPSSYVRNGNSHICNSPNCSCDNSNRLPAAYPPRHSVSSREKTNVVQPLRNIGTAHRSPYAEESNGNYPASYQSDEHEAGNRLQTQASETLPAGAAVGADGSHAAANPDPSMDLLHESYRDYYRSLQKRNEHRFSTDVGPRISGRYSGGSAPMSASEMVIRQSEEIDALRIEIAALKSENQNLKTELKLTIRSLQKGNFVIGELQSQVNSANRQKESLRVKFKELAATYRESETEVEQMLNQLRSYISSELNNVQSNDSPPALRSPGVRSPGVQNPRIQNPPVQNPRVMQNRGVIQNRGVLPGSETLPTPN